jgi:signal transduction histidine kinase/CheY-like chemotaxis protein
MLTSRQPMFIWWGDALINLYNDAYIGILQAKHPGALGQPASIVWREIWDQVGPRAEQAMRQNVGTYDEALLLMERNGYPEETYYTFSYSPVPNDQGGTGGIICANTEDTRRIVSERQLGLLRELAAKTADARSWPEACALSMACLRSNPYDLPFALLYVVDQEHRRVELAGTAGIDRGHPAAPKTLALDAEGIWPIDESLRTNRAKMIADLAGSFGSLPTGAWNSPPTQAIAIPILVTGQRRRSAVLIAGLSPHRLYDDGYRGFMELVSAQIASGLTNAETHEEERKRAEALAELDRAKTAFFSNVSHEFRTPLTLMLGPVEDALGRLDGGLREPDLALVHRNGLRLLKLVNTLLDFARIEAGRVDAVFQPTDLAQQTSELTSNFRSATERAGLRLVVDCPPLPEPIYVDRDMWEKIVLNLVSNAFKFTFEGEIRVSLRHQKGWVELEVRDTGVGIPDAELGNLFERFHRVEGTRGRTQEGTGIGLALVYELARLNGGSVAAASRLGEGTTFTVRIPTGKAHLPADQIQASVTLTSTGMGAMPYVEEALRWLPQGADEPRGAPGFPGNEELRSTLFGRDRHATAHVVLADDNADMREYVRRLLGTHYVVDAVTDGAAALDAVRARRPDLVVADIMMPILDGFDLLRSLRADPRTRTIPVILLSARAGEESRVEGLKAGADDYIVKPFGARELLARVSASLELARVRQEAESALRDSMERETSARAEAEAAHQHLHDLFMQAPAVICMLRGPDHVFELANPVYLKMVGNRDILGKPVREALPELIEQGFCDLLDNVYRTGQPLLGTEVPVQLDRFGDGNLIEVFFNFVYQAYRNPSGQISGIFVHAVDVTNQVRARQEIEAAVRARDEFVSVAAHELKTPVTGIKGNAQLLALTLNRGKLTEERLHRYITSIVTASTRLANLTNDLLDVSRIQTGRLELDLATVDLAALIRDIVSRYRDNLEGAHTIRLELPSDACHVSADAARIEQVLFNLLDNAIKYSPNKSRIVVSLDPSGHDLILRVRDDGIGISPEYLDAIFEPFGRAVNASRRQLPGMGLGLYICRTIVERHAGMMWAESLGENHGTTMVVSLPGIDISKVDRDG